MATYEQRDNSGALFRNDKGDNQRRPDYRGDCKIDGKTWRISAWMKDGKKGRFMSLSFEPPRDPAAGNPPERQDERADAGEESLPF